MAIIKKYDDFLAEKEFTSIIEGMLAMSLNEEARQTGPNTFEWDDITPQEYTMKDFLEEYAQKMKNFLKSLSKEKIRDYFYKMLKSLKSLPDKTRRNILVVMSGVFLTFGTLNWFTSPEAVAHSIKGAPKATEMAVKKAVKEFEDLSRTSSFEDAQSLVKTAEAGYSDDRKDNGNWIDVPGGQRFVGTNHGISAPVLADYLGKLPKKEDMKNLSYETALKIFKDQYWDPQNLEKFCDQSVANLIYDACVNQGVEATKVILRNALQKHKINVPSSESPFSERWIKKANALQQKDFFETVKGERESRYRKADTFSTHGEGWLNRLDSIDYEKTT